MSVDCLDKQWGCGAPSENLQRVSSMVRDMGDPCLHPSPIKVLVAVNKMLKLEKWQTVFDSDGKVLGFQKALKLITLGGVDPSIRPEVWEFLLGCYALSSTRDYRNLLRAARRERYEELVKQCQTMHSSIGTGSLAYVVGSKIMDVRTYSKREGKREAESEERQASDDHTNTLNDCHRNNSCTDTTYTPQRESFSSDSSDIVSIRENIDIASYDASCVMPSPSKFDPNSLKFRGQPPESRYPVDNFFDFPPLPVTNLFERSDEDENGNRSQNDEHYSTPRNVRVDEECMDNAQFSNTEELIVESNGSPSDIHRHSFSSEIEIASGQCEETQEQMLRRDIQSYKHNVLNRLRISDVPEATELFSSSGPRGVPGEDKVSEWLWTLHRIVVDVVRTDSHLEFYEDPKNLARMSDILAVYAWVDPETGYCQGMSDLLSPFVVLFENDADAFWCFEMLLRRTRENFRMEGETGVMKQLQTLWRVLKLTDREMFSHLSHIGAESLHFAFRMLLVLFRRELSFSESLCMWEESFSAILDPIFFESSGDNLFMILTRGQGCLLTTPLTSPLMMWAADFDESLAWNLADSCLEALVLQLPNNLDTEVGVEKKEVEEVSSKSGSLSRHENIEHAVSDETIMKAMASNNSFCGLTKSLWSRNDRMHESAEFSVSRNRDDELPVFCVASILILNRHKIIKETRSLDDLIKIFNDNILKIKVRRCIRTAIKLRKKYLYKLIKSNNPPLQNES